ncbi:MAG TPA: alpha/beta hydrolase [Actinomycetota bacterium]|nr:alpha/beta hydrolase [Actinomycetota bacterium]
MALVLAVAVITVAAACGDGGGSPASPPSGSRAVTFRSADGVRLAGRLFGTGSTGVVLSHMLPADQSSWWRFAARLADQGYLALTYDFRGYCPGGAAGCSEGSKDVSAIWQDVVGAIGFLSGHGARSVMLVGASMGGTASLVAAARPGIDVAAVVTLSSPQSIEGLVADADTLSRVRAAKLFVAGNADPTGSASAAENLYRDAPPPKRIQIVTSGDHGTDLLTGSQSGVVSTMILNYLAQYRG